VSQKATSVTTSSNANDTVARWRTSSFMIQPLK
jgi:hypothetical protein